MNALLICSSRHHGNTRRLAEAMAPELRARIVSPGEITAEDVDRADLVGLGSGVYFGMFAPDLRRLLHSLPDQSGKPCILYSTSGLPSLTRIWHGYPKWLAVRHGFKPVGEFGCAGYDTVGPLKWLGGLNRGHPNPSDLKRAACFARALAARYLDEGHNSNKPLDMKPTARGPFAGPNPTSAAGPQTNATDPASASRHSVT